MYRRNSDTGWDLSYMHLHAAWGAGERAPESSVTVMAAEVVPLSEKAASLSGNRAMPLRRLSLRGQPALSDRPSTIARPTGPAR